MKVLIIFSSPADQKPLRLDKEDRVISHLAREFKEVVEIERQHASEIEDFHSLILDGGYDVIQFSGHGLRRMISSFFTHINQPFNLHPQPDSLCLPRRHRSNRRTPVGQDILAQYLEDTISQTKPSPTR